MSAGEFGVPGIFTNVRDRLILVRLPDLRIVLFNPAAAQLTGVAEQKALNETLDHLFPAPEVLRTVRACARRPVGVWPGHDQEALPARRPGGAESDDLELHFCRIEDVGVGGPLVLLVLRPAAGAHLGKAIQQGRSARRRVGELESDIGKLEEDAKQLALHLSEATHEFNTPLTIIALQATLLRRAIGTESPSQDKALKIINANVHRLVLLARDLTDLSRAETGRLLGMVETLDIVALARDEVANFQELATGNGITIAVATPEGRVPVAGDAARLRQVLANLVGNALKFTPPKGHVTVTVTATEDGAHIEVKDDGPGMTAPDMERLFQPFVRIIAPGAPKKPGTGLGLHITKRIVEAHGGEVGCASDGPGTGMTFWVRLPGPAQQGGSPSAVDTVGSRRKASHPARRRRRADRPPLRKESHHAPAVSERAHADMDA